MAFREILTCEEDVFNDLRKECRAISAFDDRLNVLIDDMIETLHSTKNAVGLAAPQIRSLKRVAVVDIRDGTGVIELINPVIVEEKGEQVDVEGCLSFPDRFGLVKRPQFVKVKSFNRLGEELCFEAEGLLARVFCHEIDHLYGRVFVDKVEGKLLGLSEIVDKLEKENKKNIDKE